MCVHESVAKRMVTEAAFNRNADWHRVTPNGLCVNECGLCANKPRFGTCCNTYLRHNTHTGECVQRQLECAKLLQQCGWCRWSQPDRYAMWLLVGMHRERFVIECREKTIPVAELKHMIMEDKGIPVDDMCLNIRGRYGMVTMVDDQLVTDYIQNGVLGANEMIHLTVRLYGKEVGGAAKTKGWYFGSRSRALL